MRFKLSSNFASSGDKNKKRVKKSKLEIFVHVQKSFLWLFKIITQYSESVVLLILYWSFLSANDRINWTMIHIPRDTNWKTNRLCWKQGMNEASCRITTVLSTKQQRVKTAKKQYKIVLYGCIMPHPNSNDSFQPRRWMGWQPYIIARICTISDIIGSSKIGMCCKTVHRFLGKKTILYTWEIISLVVCFVFIYFFVLKNF